MTRRAAWAIAVVAAWSAAGDAQPVRVRSRVRRFGVLRVTACSNDPPPDVWRRRVQEEFGDPTFLLYEPSDETAAIHAEFRVTLRAMRCTEGAEAYELFMTDARGEAAQTTMLRMGGVPRDDRPQVAALRVAEVFRTHRGELLGPDPTLPVVDIPESRIQQAARAPQWDLELGAVGRSLRLNESWLVGPHLAVGRRPDPESRQRWRGELGAALTQTRDGQVPFRVWVAGGWTFDLVRSRWVDFAVGARVEIALNASYPTLTAGTTAEGQFAVSDWLWLWVRVDAGWHVIGAQVLTNLRLKDVATGFTWAPSLGVRFAL